MSDEQHKDAAAGEGRVLRERRVLLRDSPSNDRGSLPGEGMRDKALPDRDALERKPGEQGGIAKDHVLASEHIHEHRDAALSPEQAAETTTELRPEPRHEVVSEPLPEVKPEPRTEPRTWPILRVDLVSWVKSRAYGTAYGNQFQKLPASQWASFRALITAFLRDEQQKVGVLAPRFGMGLWQVEDTITKRWFWLLQENKAPGVGLGLYLRPLSPKRVLVLQSPHPIQDKSTHAVGAYLLRELEPQLLMIASLQRCNHNQKTTCSGSTSQCKGVYRISDVAHYTEAAFHIAHEAIDAMRPRLPVLQLHGFARKSSEPSIFLSDGTKTKAAPGALVLKLRDAFSAALKKVGLYRAESCNDPKDTKARLCATTNVQGRHTNGSTQVCTRSASRGSGWFVHAEFRLRLREGSKPGPVLIKDVLGQVFP